MTTITTGQLDVPGARLHHQRQGRGPSLLLLHGGASDAEAVAGLAAALADRFTVVSYDRRGFGRSPLTADPVPADEFLAANADDAAAVLAALDAGPAHVFGSSSGAIVSLELLRRHPDAVRTVVPHEPPLFALLPDAAERVAFFAEVLRVHREQGVQAAIRMHLADLGLSMPQPPPIEKLPPEAAARVERMEANQDYWLRHEVEAVRRYHPDVEALRVHRGRLALAGGQEAHDGYVYRSTLALARLLDLPLASFPGDHIGYAFRPAEFADTLADLLAVNAPR